MRNLFVCHTQAQLILSCGLALGRFKSADNHLILFQDFLLTDKLKSRLENVFDKILYLQSVYPKKMDTFSKKLKNYPINDRKMKQMMLQPYDKVFTICDTIYPEQKCMKIAYNLNHKTDFCWLEDGITAYYQNVIIRGGLDSNFVLRYFRKVLFKYIKNLGHFYDRDFPEFGGSKYNKTIYCLYPNAVREPYKSTRMIEGICDEEYLQGLEAMYDSCVLPIKAGDIILIMDKFDTYKNPVNVKKTIQSLIRENLILGNRIFCKFHPRETEKWDIFKGCICLDNTVGAESLYLSLSKIANDVKIVGIKSAGLMSAVKLGFQTFSLFSHCGEDNEDLIDFFKKINVQLI